MQTFLTASELSRAVNCPLSRITNAINAGRITADGRAGQGSNAPILFNSDRIEVIKAAIQTSAPTRKHAVSPEAKRIKAKVAALNKARRENSK
jgi:hypothetical protein